MRLLTRVAVVSAVIASGVMISPANADTVLFTSDFPGGVVIDRSSNMMVVPDTIQTRVITSPAVIEPTVVRRVITSPAVIEPTYVNRVITRSAVVEPTVVTTPMMTSPTIIHTPAIIERDNSLLRFGVGGLLDFSLF